MKKELTLILLLSLFVCQHAWAAEWQWSVKIPGIVSPETNAHPEAFLWIPSNCEQVRAVVFGQHNMCEETLFEHPAFRKQMCDLGFAIVWLTPGIEQQWDVRNGCQAHFETMMNDLAAVSGYDELSRVPVVPVGHSAMATFPWNFAAWNPARTLAIISYHGDAPRTNLTGYGRENLEWGRTRNIDGIPGLMIIGEYEWWEARVNPALAFRMMYPESCISMLCDAGHGHFDVSAEVVDYLSLFLKKAAEYRLTDEADKLKKVDVCKGWLAERWHPASPGRPQTAPFSTYAGDKHDAFWYFDEETALATERYYARESGKQMRHIGFVKHREPCAFNKEAHAQYNISFSPEADGITFHLSAAFTDSLRRMPQAWQKGEIHISRICGPVKVVNDTTFVVDFYRMGLNNKKRTGSINLLAHSKANDVYKSSVQHLAINIPYPQTEGKKQVITFPPLKDVNKGVKAIALTATADSGLPVSYYIKEGPAEVDGNILRLKPLPPRAKHPVKVTVVAWQYGRSTGEKVQTAEAVERSFYVTHAP